MRADGSYKTLTDGLATVDKSKFGDKKYMKECLNFRNDQINGLQRRAPVDVVKPRLALRTKNPISDAISTRNVTEFDVAKDALKPFTVGTDEYWLYISSASGDTEVAVLDSGGNAVTTKAAPYDYLKSVAGNDSLRVVSDGELVYLVNREEEVKILEGSAPSDFPIDNSSLIVVREPPAVYSTLIVTWKYKDGSIGVLPYEIGEDHPIQPIPDSGEVDNGVNTIAALLASAIQDKMTTDGDTDWSVYANGGTVVFRDVTVGVGETTNIEVEIQDGTGGALVAINDQVANLEDLPRYAPPNKIVSVRKDPRDDRGVFYMQSSPANSPDGLQTGVELFDENIMTAGERVSGNSTITGFSFGLGSMSPTGVSGYPDSDIAELTATTRTEGKGEANSTTVTLKAFTSAGPTVRGGR